MTSISNSATLHTDDHFKTEQCAITERNGRAIDVEAMHVTNSSDEVVTNTELIDDVDYCMSHLNRYWTDVILNGIDFRADSATGAGETACRKCADLDWPLP